MPAVNPWTHEGVIDTQAFAASEPSCAERVQASVIVPLKFRLVFRHWARWNFPGRTPACA